MILAMARVKGDQLLLAVVTLKTSCKFIRVPLQFWHMYVTALGRQKLITHPWEMGMTCILHVCEQQVFHSDQHFQSCEIWKVPFPLGRGIKRFGISF